MKKLYDRFIWETESSEIFLRAMKDYACKHILEKFMLTGYGNNCTDIAVHDFTMILVEAGKQSLRLKTAKTSDTQKSKKLWFDTECFESRKYLRKKGRLLKKRTNHTNLASFSRDCKSYKKLLKKKQHTYKQKLIKEMENFDNKNPQAYWNNLDKLRSFNSDTKVDSSNITPEEWIDHFKHLAQENRSDGTLLNKLELLENDRYHSSKTRLDFPFAMKEVKAVIRNCSNGKSSSDDLLLYEMFKSCINIISPALTKLFNIVLNNESFPELWNIAFQVPIFKGGDMFDSNNYRGISLTSCLGKMFNKALNNRLQDDIDSNSKLIDTQAAYRHKFSTTDQIFIFNSLLNKYVKTGKRKLYVCFVDFRKAFDNIWHTGLLYKLISNFDIGGKF